jgi:hypothetical protein
MKKLTTKDIKDTKMFEDKEMIKTKANVKRLNPKVFLRN